jgi:hypothetical protein
MLGADAADATEHTYTEIVDALRQHGSMAIRILSDVEHAVNKWRQVGHSIGMSNRELDQFAAAFEHRERKASAMLING